MNACVPTYRSVCVNKKPEAKPRSEEASARMNFYMMHDIKVVTDHKSGTAKMEISRKPMA